MRVQSNIAGAVSPILELDCGDWSRQEQCEIDRVRPACMEHPNLSLEFGLTDEADPWCIVYDLERERAIFHLARIDHCYIVVRPNPDVRRQHNGRGNGRRHKSARSLATVNEAGALADHSPNSPLDSGPPIKTRRITHPGCGPWPTATMRTVRRWG